MCIKFTNYIFHFSYKNLLHVQLKIGAERAHRVTGIETHFVIIQESTSCFSPVTVLVGRVPRALLVNAFCRSVDSDQKKVATLSSYCRKPNMLNELTW